LLDKLTEGAAVSQYIPLELLSLAKHRVFHDAGSLPLNGGHKLIELGV